MEQAEVSPNIFDESVSSVDFQRARDLNQGIAKDLESAQRMINSAQVDFNLAEGPPDVSFNVGVDRSMFY